MKTDIIIYIKIAWGIFLLTLVSFVACAQLSPLKSQFFQNPYLVNPSMAGYADATSVFLNYGSQWNKIEGAPVMMSLSASTHLTNKAAIGFNIITDKAGLLRRSQAMGTYAYKLVISPEHQVRLGVSVSWADDRIDESKATSSGTIDPSLLNYNDNSTYMDGNFGITYIHRRFMAQFSYLNLNNKRLKEFSTVDYSTFYSAVSYEFDLDNSGLKVRPLIACRGINGHDNLWDVAAEWQLNKMMLYSMYHSNGSFTGGFGFAYKSALLLSGMYGTAPRGLGNLSGGQFDLTLGYTF